ncbi:MAG: 50S ribosomal protein L31 [Candidatus Paceibacterota bacterium]
MKKDIHGDYFADAVATCACGAKYTVGSTQKDIEVEICSACHPFYTGQEKVLDTAGRVDRFKKKVAAATAKKATKKA